MLLSGSRTPRYPRGTQIKNDRQVSIVSAEELAQIQAALGVPELRPEWLGANLVLQGLPKLTQLPPSTRLYFAQGATLVVAQSNAPCTNPGKLIRDFYNQPGLETQFPKAAFGLRGVVAYVEKPGLIAEGDAVQTEIPQQVLYTLDEAK
jgi:MOSC domain-containing protein YiiM